MQAAVHDGVYVVFGAICCIHDGSGPLIKGVRLCCNSSRSALAYVDVMQLECTPLVYGVAVLENNDACLFHTFHIGSLCRQSAALET
jgi:hypothetical protein